MVTGMIVSALRNSRDFGYIAQSQAFNTTALVAGQSNFETDMQLLLHSKKGTITSYLALIDLLCILVFGK